MSRLIDDFKNRISSYNKEYAFSQEEVLNILERYEIKYRKVKAIKLEKVKQAREQIIDEKDFAYADFDRYKEEVLNVESDELPDDDFRYGMERCLEILDRLITESDVVK